MRRRSAAWKRRPAGRTKERKKSILRRYSVKDTVAWTSSSPEPPQDATQEYLNHVEPLKSFVYKRERLVTAAGGSTEIEVEIEPRANGQPICSGCGKKRPGYDRLPARRLGVVRVGPVVGELADRGPAAAVFPHRELRGEAAACAREA